MVHCRDVAAGFADAGAYPEWELWTYRYEKARARWLAGRSYGEAMTALREAEAREQAE